MNPRSTIFCMMIAAIVVACYEASVTGPVHVVIRVTNAAGGPPLVAEQVYLVKERGGFGDIATGTTDEDGNVVIDEPLAPGTWFVEHHQRFGGSWKTARSSLVITPDQRSYQTSLRLHRPGIGLTNTPAATP